MNQDVAKEIFDAVVSIDAALGRIDEIVSKIGDEERMVWVDRLGNIFRIMNDEIIKPMARDFPEFNDL